MTSHSTIDTLVRMANQIAAFFKTQNAETAHEAVADHIAKFWDPRMRATMLAHLAAGAAGVDPVVVRGLTSQPLSVTQKGHVDEALPDQLL